MVVKLGAFGRPGREYTMPKHNDRTMSKSARLDVTVLKDSVGGRADD
jgi:hypothetical protein